MLGVLLLLRQLLWLRLLLRTKIHLRLLLLLLELRLLRRELSVRACGCVVRLLLLVLLLLLLLLIRLLLLLILLLLLLVLLRPLLRISLLLVCPCSERAICGRPRRCRASSSRKWVRRSPTRHPKHLQTARNEGEGEGMGVGKNAFFKPPCSPAGWLQVGYAMVGGPSNMDVDRWIEKVRYKVFFWAGPHSFFSAQCVAWFNVSCQLVPFPELRSCCF